MNQFIDVLNYGRQTGAVAIRWSAGLVLIGLIAGLTGVSAVAAPSLSIAGAQSCAALATGAIHCWQYPTTAGLHIPVPHVTDAADVSVGNSHACYTTTSGQSLCWGANGSGQLGTGDAQYRSIPTSVVGIDSIVVTTQTAQEHSCALLVNGGVRCWGRNNYGQLGDGTNTDRSVAAAVTGLPGPAIAIGLAVNTSCAIIAGGELWCWGSAVSQQLSDRVPVRVGWPSLSAVKVSVGVTRVGIHRVCVITVSGEVQCFARGLQEFGPPVSTGFISVAIASTATCALHQNGGVYCWGSGRHGLLGAATSGDDQGVIQVNGAPGGAVSLAAGVDMMCLLSAPEVTAGVKCWGANDVGQLGDLVPELPFATAVAPVAGLNAQATLDVSGGRSVFCSRLNDGTARCWGPNYAGQTADGSLAHRWDASQPVALPQSILQTASGEWTTCAITADSIVRCVGSAAANQNGEHPGLIPAPVLRASDGLPLLASEVQVGFAHACARGGAGVQCWGEGSGTQLGGAVAQSTTAVDVPGLPAALSSLAVGSLFSCAVAAGNAWCWGDNFVGSLGDGTQIARASPVAVVGLDASALKVFSGTYHSCALMQSGPPRCWGANHYGQLGQGASIEAAPVALAVFDAGTETMALGDSFTCALKDGTVKCIGRILGRQTLEAADAAALLPTDITHIAASLLSLCARRQNGEILCVGENMYGQLGRGSAGYRVAPTSFVPNLNFLGKAVLSASDRTFINEPMTLTMSLPGSSASGTVSFLLDNDVISGCAAVPVSAQIATCVTTLTAVATMNAVAEYQGNALDPPQTARTSIRVTGSAENSMTLTVPPLNMKWQPIPIIVDIVGNAGPIDGVATITVDGIQCVVPLVAGHGQCTYSAGYLGLGSPVTARYDGDSMHRANSASATLNVVAEFDFNADGVRDASDGLIFMRYLLGLRGSALLDGIDISTALRPGNVAVAQYLDSILYRLDIDQDGRRLLTTDGVLLLRFLLGLRGTALISNAVGSDAVRTASTAIEDYIRTYSE